MPKKTRLKLEDNIRRCLITVLGVALLVTSMQFTNIHAEEDEPEPSETVEITTDAAEGDAEAVTETTVLDEEPVDNEEETTVEEVQEYELTFVIDAGRMGLFADWLEVTLNGEVISFTEDDEGSIISKVNVKDGTAELKVDVEKYATAEGEDDVAPYKYYKIDDVEVNGTSLEGNEGVYSVPVGENTTVTIVLGEDMQSVEPEEETVEEAAVFAESRQVKLGKIGEIKVTDGTDHHWYGDSKYLYAYAWPDGKRFVYYGVNLGTVNVRHTYTENGETKTEIYPIEIVEPDSYEVVLKINESMQFSRDDQEYISYDTGVVQVSQHGLATGIREGETTIMRYWEGIAPGYYFYSVKVVPDFDVIIPVLSADKKKDLLPGDVVTFDVKLENTNTFDLKSVTATIDRPSGAKFVDTGTSIYNLDIDSYDTKVLKAQYTVTEDDLKEPLKDIEFTVSAYSSVLTQPRSASIKVSPFDPQDAIDVSKALAAGSKDHDLKAGDVVYYDIYVRNNTTAVIKDIVVEELLKGAEIVDDGSGLYEVTDGKAVISYIGRTEIIPVKAKYVVTANDVKAKKPITNTAKATYVGVEKISNGVAIRPDSVDTIEVYVYMKVGGFTKAALDALGLPSNLVVNDSKFAPVGVLTVDKSFITDASPKYSNDWDTNMRAMLRSSADWDRLFDSVISFDPNGMVDVGNKHYSQNNGNKVTVEQVKLARRDTGYTAGSDYTAMFTQNGSERTKEYGKNDYQLHLDCVFDTVKVTFVDENGNPYKEGGVEVPPVNYIKGQHISNPGFVAPEGFVVEYYVNGETKQWNFATDTVTGDTKIQVVLRSKQGVTAVTKEVLNPKKDESGKTIPFAVGDTVNFSIVVKNDGNFVYEDVVVEDQLTGAQIIPLAGGSYTIDKNGNALISRLNPGQQVTIRASYVTKADDTGKTITNKAVATPKEGPKGDATTTFQVSSTVTATVKSEEFTYDGQNHSAAVVFSGLPGGYTATATSAETVKDVDQGAVVAKVDLTSVVIKDKDNKVVTDKFVVNTVNGSIKVKPATLTVTTPYSTKVYDGTPLTAAGSMSGLVSGDKATFTTTGTQTAVGYSTNTYKIDWDAGTKQSNYSIAEDLGTLIVTQYAEEITVTTTGGTFTYDGQPHGATVSVSTLPKGYTLYDAGSNATATHVAEGTVAAKCDKLIITNAKGEDVSKKLNIKYIDGSITITPATLTVTTPSASKTYDGTALTAAGTMTGLVNSETLTFTTTGSQTAVGSSANSYTITWDGTAVPTDYTVKATVGTLTVTSVTPPPGPTPTPTPTPPGPPIVPTPTPTPVPPAPPAPPVVPPVEPEEVPEEITPAAPTEEVEVDREDTEPVDRGDYGLNDTQCVLHVFILLLAAVVEAFLYAKVKKDNKELEDKLA